MQHFGSQLDNHLEKIINGYLCSAVTFFIVMGYSKCTTKRIMKNTLLLFLFFCSIFQAKAQDGFDWTWMTNSVAPDGVCSQDDSYIDENGNTYVIGTFQSSTVKIGDITATQRFRKKQVFNICAGGCPDEYTSDVFIAKIDVNGEAEWVQTVEGWGVEFGMSITANAAGEVWCIIRTTGDTVLVDNEMLILNQIDDYSSENVFLKLDDSGQLDWIKGFEGEDNLTFDAHLFHYNANVSMIANFSYGNDGTVDVFGASVPAHFSYSMYVYAVFDGETGVFKTIKGLGEDVGGGQFLNNNFQDIQEYDNHIYVTGTANTPGIKFGNQLLNFTTSELNKLYVVILDSTGMAQTLFEYMGEGGRRMLINDDYIVMAAPALEYPDYENLLKVDYLSHTGAVMNSYVIPNETEGSVSMGLSAVALNNENQLIMALSIYDQFEIDGQIYSLPTSYHTHPTDGELINQYPDPLVLMLDDSGDILLKHHFVGRDLTDQVVSMAFVDGYVRLVFSQQSPQMSYGDSEVENTNEFGYDLFHDHPYGVHRFQNLVFTKVKIDDPVSSVDPTHDEGELTFYPNPATTGDQLIVKDKVDRITILNMDGTEIYTQYNSDQILIDSHLISGSYIVKVVMGSMVLSQPLIVY